MNIVLLDDNEVHNKQLKTSLLNILDRNHIGGRIALEATTFQQVLDYAKSNPPLTVYFLDIRLEQEQTGLDICKQLRRDTVRDRFVFVSAYPHYALDCLKVHAYDLLLKPVDLQALNDCVLSLYKEIAGDISTAFEIQIGSRTIRVPISQIHYVEACGRNVCVHSSQGNYTYASSLLKAESLLSGYAFVRIHRKYLVNKAYVQEWDSTADEVLICGERLPVSRRMLKNLTSEGRQQS